MAILYNNLALVNGLVCYTYGYKNQEHSLYHENEVRMVIMDVRDSYNHMCSTTAHWLKQLANKLIIVISNQFKINKVNIIILSFKNSVNKLTPSNPDGKIIWYFSLW